MPSRDHSLISSLYHNFSRRILGLLLKRNGGDLIVAEDILQSTFVSAIKSFHTFHNKSTYFTWLCRIALNKLADYYRQQVNSKSQLIAPSLEQLNYLPLNSLSFEEQLVLDELRTSVNRCLDLLPSSYRRLLHLRYYQDLSTTQISLILGLSPRQVEGRLYRAKKTLAKVFNLHHLDSQ